MSPANRRPNAASAVRSHRNWRSVPGGRGAEAKRLKAVEEEAVKLMKLPAESMMHVPTFREMLEKQL